MEKDTHRESKELQQQLIESAIPKRVLCNEHQAAEITGFAVQTLRRRRMQGLPPSFLKLGQRVTYDRQVLEDYLNDSICTSTKESKQKLKDEMRNRTGK